MKPIVIMRQGQCLDEKLVASMIEAEGYLVVFTHTENALTMLDPNRYNTSVSHSDDGNTTYVTIDVTGPKPGTPCS